MEQQATVVSLRPTILCGRRRYTDEAKEDRQRTNGGGGCGGGGAWAGQGWTGRETDHLLKLLPVAFQEEARRHSHAYYSWLLRSPRQQVGRHYTGPTMPREATASRNPIIYFCRHSVSPAKGLQSQAVVAAPPLTSLLLLPPG